MGACDELSAMLTNLAKAPGHDQDLNTMANGRPSSRAAVALSGGRDQPPVSVAPPAVGVNLSTALTGVT